MQQSRLRNPHSFLEVLVAQADGTSDIWICETQAKSVISRKGISVDRFTPGQRVTIIGSAARTDDRRCEVGEVHFNDGSQLVFRSIEGRANIGNYAVPTTKDSDALSVLGTWIRASFRGFPVESNIEEALTSQAVKANSTYRAATDDPSNFCVAANPVRAWIAPGTPAQIRREDNQVIIQHEFMDVERRVILHDDPQQLLREDLPSDHKPDTLGYSFGKFALDTLTVYSKGFAPGVLITQYGESGVLYSDQLILVENYSVNKDSGELDYAWQAYDENYFPSGIKGQLSLTRVDMKIGQFDCQLDNED